LKIKNLKERKTNYGSSGLAGLPQKKIKKWSVVGVRPA
jgi:hypothetical protein